MTAWSATVHVSPAGDDLGGDGSPAKPWRSLQKATATLKPGDTLKVGKGIYTQRLAIQVSGAAGQPVSIIGEAGAILSGKGLRKTAQTSMIEIADQSHIVISGLEICDTTSSTETHGIHVDGVCAGITIRDCHFHHLLGTEATAIGIYGTSPESAITDVTIEGCHIHDCQPAGSEALVVNGNVDGFRILNNHVHDVNNIAIDMIGGETSIMKDKSRVARNGVCRGNRVERALSTYEGGYAAGIYVDGGQDILIEGNTVTGCDLGIEVGAENPGITTTRITVRHNRIYRNQKAGLVFGGYEPGRGRVTASNFSSNLLWENTLNKKAEAELWIQEASGNTVSGNIIVQSGFGSMISAVEGGVRNTLENNIYHHSDGAEGFSYTWGDAEGSGFKPWQKASGQDAKSVFKALTFPNPAVGDFGVLPWEKSSGKP